MSILVVGSVAFDTLKTPYGERQKILGGAATYFSLSASYFTEVRVVAVVGEDFTPENEAVMNEARSRHPRHPAREREDISLDRRIRRERQRSENAEHRTQRLRDLCSRRFPPSTTTRISCSWPTSILPCKHACATPCKMSQLVGGDTMNYWISGHRADLEKMLKRVDVLLINDGEAKMLAGDNSLPRAARKVMDDGPARAGHQARRVRRDHLLPRRRICRRTSSLSRARAMPMDEVRDPTGAGDSFAGGFMGYVASQGEVNRRVLKHAMFYGSVMGSFAVERFGTERLQSLTRDEIDERFKIFRELTHLD